MPPKKSSPKPKSSKRRVVKKSKKIERQTLDEVVRVGRMLDDSANSVLGFCDDMRNENDKSLLSNRVAAELFGVEKERDKLDKLLAEIARTADRLQEKVRRHIRPTVGRQV